VKLSALTVMVLVSAIGLAAQAPGGRAGRGAGAPTANGKVTVDGCVQNAPAGSTSTSKYILAGARPSPRAGGAGRATAEADAASNTATEGSASATNTNGATQAAGTAAAAQTAGTAPAAGAGAGARGRGAAAAGPAAPVRYQLDGDEKIITPHLNHVVEVTGLLSGEPPPPGRGAGGPGAGPAPITQTLKIESLKMVAALCS
jgi:hypothetical protein